MKTLQDHIDSYRNYHQKRFTKLTHAIAIPMLTLAILIFCSWLRISFAEHWQINVSWLIVFGIVSYYIHLHVGLGMLMTFILGLLSGFADWIAGDKPTLISSFVFLLLFLISLLLIHLGHAHEQRHATAPKNLYHFSVALLMLVIELLDWMGVFKHLKRDDQ